jgi:uncharacterized protein
MKKYLLDTNILLRFLLADHAELWPKASRLFQQAADRKCLLVLSDLGIAEAVWVLTSYYKIDRKSVAENLAKLVVRAGVYCPSLDLSLTLSLALKPPIAIFLIAIWRRRRTLRYRRRLL